MAVTYYQLDKSTTSIPTTTGTSSYVDGFYGVNGTLEYLIAEVNLTLSGTVDVTTDLSALIKSAKIVINGDIIHDWISGSAPAASSAIAGRYGYFINAIGGRSLTVPSVADMTGGTVQAFIAIPVGYILNTPTPRFEMSMEYYDANLVLGASAAIDSGSVTWWARFNTATERSTRVISATSYAFAGANVAEQVVVRVPQTTMNGATTMGCLIQNDSEADEYTDGNSIRQLALSQFSMPVSLHRWASNELDNGVVASIPASSTTSQTVADKRVGALFVPLYGLKANDLTWIISSSAATTRFFHPVLTAPLRGPSEERPVQTAVARGNVQKTVVSRSEAGTGN
tara:strand:+ start:2030 stop:3052 length:1023 start_codon:yes stop_codon:yes gene_type:complete